MARIYTWYIRGQSDTPINTDHDYGGDVRFFVDYSVSQNIASNYSDIYYDLYMGVNPTKGVVLQYADVCRVYINSVVVKTGSTREGVFYSAGSSVKIASGSYRVYHNSSGVAPNTYIQGYGQAHLWTGAYYGSDSTLNTKVSIPNILRYATITEYSVVNNGLTSLRVNWNANVFIDRVEYSLSGGAWTYVEKAMPFYINGLNPGTQYSVKIRVRRQDSQLWTESGTAYATTTDIARITNANVDFNVDNGITVYFNNPSGSKTDVWIEGIDKIGGTAQYSIPLRESVSSPFVYTLTQAEKNTLFNNNPNRDKFPARICVRTASNNNYVTWKDGYASITNANPTFNNFTFADINSQTIALTGSNQKIIKGYSNLRATVSTTDKAVAIKGATMVNYQLVVGGKQKIEPYSASANVNLDLNAIDNNVFTVYAIDSRGNSTDKIKSPLDFIEYFKPTITYFGFKRENDTGTKTTLILSGKWFNKTFGSVANTLTVKYYFKATNSQIWSDPITITVTKNGDDFSFDSPIQGDLGAVGFDSTKDFDIKFELTDKLGIYTFEGYLIESGEPDIALHKMGVAIKAPYNPALGGPLQIDGKLLTDFFYPVGTLYETTSSNLDTVAKMNAYFGGTWEFYGAGRVIVGYNASETEFNTIGKTIGEKTHILTSQQLPKSMPFKSTGFLGSPASGGVAISMQYATAVNTENTIGLNIVNDNGGQAHNNLQPSIAVYRYRRIS